MSLRSIFLTLIVFALVWYWLRAREIKEQSLKAAAKYCEKLSLKLLDEAVSLRSLKPVRNASGGLSIRRCYQFDFTSNGEDRYLGEIVIIGQKIDQIKLQPHRID